MSDISYLCLAKYINLNQNIQAKKCFYIWRKLKKEKPGNHSNSERTKPKKEKS